VKTKKKILGGAIGSDVHVAGILNFLELAKKEGYETIYLGGALSLEKFLGSIIETNPDLIAVSYRLGKEALDKLLIEFKDLLRKNDLLKNKDFVFGGTYETAKVARKSRLFRRVFDGSESVEEVVLYLRGEMRGIKKESYPQKLVERINFKSPYPLIRHHIGLQSLEETEREIQKLARSEELDIISLAPDQNAQQWFFTPEKMDPSQDGAGGAPFRKKEDFERMYKASRQGNFPLLRCYSGTRELIKYSKLLYETIRNAWAAIPLTWYSELDRRSDRELKKAIAENQKAIKWNAEHDIPVEINESHQWALRYAPDTVEVATAYIAAYNAKKLGVKTYVAQYMFNTPPGISPAMDIAKMLAKKELIESLHDNFFRSYRMVRAGLLSFPSDEARAKGQLVSSMLTASYLQPHIIHVVAFCEARKRAKAKEIIESVKMVKRAYSEAMKGLPNFEADPKIRARKKTLIEEARLIIEAIKELGKGSKDPLTDPDVIWASVKMGILDAPGLMKMSVARGTVKTAIIDGTNQVVDDKGRPVSERKRLKALGFAL